MIVVDTSALMEIILDEPHAESCEDVLSVDQPRLISAATVTEALIVAGRKKLADRMEQLLEGLSLTCIEVDHDFALKAAEAYQRWGKGVHSAKLNFGDCFAYALAHEKRCPLLYIGNDFAQTDIVRAF